MAKRDDSKIKTIAIYRMLDSGRKMNAKEIMDELYGKYGIVASRKTIYSDVQAVNRFFPIESTSGANGGFRKYSVLQEIEDGK